MEESSNNEDIQNVQDASNVAGEQNQVSSEEAPDVSTEKESMLDLSFLAGKIQENVSSLEGNSQDADPSQHFFEMQEQASNFEHVKLPEVQVETSVKKYVIHVDPENVDYMEHLTINERRKVINKILKEQAIFTEEEIREKRNKKRIAHLLLMVLTFSIALPVFFVAINTSVKMTLQSYSSSKNNFAKLYKEQGKIKRSNFE